MQLTKKKCVPCEGGVSPLRDSELEQYLGNVDGWNLDGNKIRKEYSFKNFVEALAFVNAVGDIAESEGHHPDIEFGWGYCRIVLYTHAIDGLHENDFIVAAKIDEI